MAKKYFVYSKITCNTVYNLPNEETIEINGVLKKGIKRNGFDKNECGVTQISLQQFEILSNLPKSHTFNIQKDLGFLKLDNEVDIDETVKSMQKKDKSYLSDEDSIKEKVETLKKMQGTVV